MKKAPSHIQLLQNEALQSSFTNVLMQWNKTHNKRTMPWKGEKDPYKIWLSEVMLQQTRVEQGWPYFSRFIEHFPTIIHLANAKDEAVFKLWEGLGYYSRCRNLLFTARFIAFELGGQFPQTYDDLIKLKGVGPYSAAAIASFAYNLPYAVVDGNVYRVIARYLGINEPTDTNIGKKLFNELANQCMHKKQPGTYNQAIMDFGATICKPALPLCASCPLQHTCKALKGGVVHQLPVKLKSIQRKNRWMYYFVFTHQKKIGILQRSNKDIWQDLHEFYLVESNNMITWNDQSIKQWLKDQLNMIEFDIAKISVMRKQQLTHQQIRGQFIHIAINEIPEALQGLKWVNHQQISQLAFPRFITAYFEEEG